MPPLSISLFLNHPTLFLSYIFPFSNFPSITFSFIPLFFLFMFLHPWGFLCFLISSLPSYALPISLPLRSLFWHFPLCPQYLYRYPSSLCPPPYCPPFQNLLYIFATSLFSPLCPLFLGPYSLFWPSVLSTFVLPTPVFPHAVLTPQPVFSLTILIPLSSFCSPSLSSSYHCPS